MSDFITEDVSPLITGGKVVFSRAREVALQVERLPIMGCHISIV